MKTDFFNKFSKKHPILLNAIYMVIAFVAVWYALFLMIDIFTGHGQEDKVPDVRNLTLEQAVQKLEQAGFNWEISDSIYNEQMRPGIVVSQEPKGNAYAKKIRTIYLNINAFSPKMVKMPVISDISVRQAQSILRSLGFKNVSVDTVPSPYEGLVLAVKVNGHQVAAGTSVSINSQVRISMGDGSLDIAPTDVLSDEMLDSLQEAQIRQAERDAKKNN